MSEKQIMQELLLESKPQESISILTTVENQNDELFQIWGFVQNKSLPSRK